MGDHLVVDVDRLARPVTTQSAVATAEVGSSLGGSGSGLTVDISGPSISRQPLPPPPPPPASSSHYNNNTKVELVDDCNDSEPLIQIAECRICQDEDCIKNLETPCGCSGSLKFAHRNCIQHWCNEKGNIICEICHQPYQPGYTAPPPRPHPEETTIDIGRGWTISTTPLNLNDPRLLAIAEAEHQFIEDEYNEYTASNASGATFCRSAALILMALLLLRYALSVTDSDDDDDPSAFFYLFLLRAAGFLLPCYIMAWAISILQRRRERQEAATLTAAQVAFVLQSGQHRGLQFVIGSTPAGNQQQEEV